MRTYHSCPCIYYRVSGHWEESRRAEQLGAGEGRVTGRSQSSGRVGSGRANPGGVSLQRALPDHVVATAPSRGGARAAMAAAAEQGCCSVYFCGSIRGGREDQALYARIVSRLRRYGKVLTEHVAAAEMDSRGEAARAGDPQTGDLQVKGTGCLGTCMQGTRRLGTCRLGTRRLGSLS